MTRSRRPAAAAAALLTLGLASGCAAFSEQTTDLDYTPSDGAQTDAGDVAVRNLFFVAEDAEGPGTLVGVLLNSGDEDVEVTLSSDDNGTQATVDVPAGQSVSLGPDGDETVEVDPVGVVPGRTLLVMVDAGGAQVAVATPVLDGSLPEYADLVPTG